MSTVSVPSVNERLHKLTSRLAHTTSTLRVRADDLARAEANGGTSDELLARMEALVSSLEKAAEKVVRSL